MPFSLDIEEGVADEAGMQDTVPVAASPVQNGFINPMMLSLASETMTDTLLHARQEVKSTSPAEASIEAAIMSLNDIEDELGFSSDAMSVDNKQDDQDDDTISHLPSNSTGCCYDDRMALHANPDWSPEESHPEAPDRIREIMKAFKDAGLVFEGTADQYNMLVKQSPLRYMSRILARPATKAEICTVHMADQYQWVEDLTTKTLIELIALSKVMEAGRRSLYVNTMTTQAALLSCGAAIDTCKHVMEGNIKNAIAVIRPPGHHAESTESMGFCIFNNVSVAARICQKDYPETCKKVLILDWDVHHGNGTQNMFYGDPSVLYISLHVYRDGDFYPGQPEDGSAFPDGDICNVGSGHGAGRNVNIGWHDQGVGDGEYMAAFQRIVMPIAQEFNPDLVIISAGFDAAAGDQLGGCFVTPACYSQMTHMLMSLADGKVAVCLEGGYDLPALRRSALAVAKTLMGYPPIRMPHGIPKIYAKANEVLDRVMEYQAPYWECMRRGRIDKLEIGQSGDRLSEVVRLYQAKKLMEEHNMLPVHILRENLYRLLEHQILCTPNIDKAKKIILILHDPPEILAYPEPFDSKIRSHNAHLVDGVKPYIDWAIKNDFGVLDINVPAVLFETTERVGYNPKPLENQMVPHIQELMEYMWDNYLELWAAEDIILMGVGDSYFGVKLLLTSRSCKERISGIVNFVTGALKPIKSETDDQLSSWYKTHSRVYVAQDHACWDSEENIKKIKRKRYGHVIKSEALSLNMMMNLHFESVTGYIEECVVETEGDDES